MRLSLARAAAAFGFAGIALLVAWIATPIGVPAAVAATLPTGFEERTVVSGLTAPTAVDWAPDGRMFVAEKAGRVRVVTAAGTLVTDAAARHLRPRASERRPRPARDRGRQQLRHEPLPLPALHVRRQRQPTATGPKTSRLTRVTVNPNNTASAETVLLGSVGAAPCPAPSNTIDCMPSDGGLALDRHRALGARRHALGRLRRRRRLRQRGPARAARLRRAELGRQDDPRRPQRPRPPRSPVLPGRTDLTHVCTKL